MIPDIGDRQPDLLIEGYLERWCLTHRRNEGSIYLHHFLAPDVPVFHDHPWEFSTQILNGGYGESTLPYGQVDESITRDFTREAGDTIDHYADDFHYIKSLLGDVWTLVTTGPRLRRTWGFINEHGEWEEHSKFEVRTGARQKIIQGPGYLETGR